MRPRLSICIATLNRADVIEATLDSILSQRSNDFEVVVVDGASTDATPRILQRYAAQDPRLRFERLPQKGGVDKDFCKAVELATGDYCWLFSDDDLLIPGAIDTVLKVISTDVALVLVNAAVRNRELNTTIEERRLKITDDLRFPPEELAKLFETVLGYISFIGCVVIRRELWLSRNKVPYMGSEFIHVGVIFQAQLPQSAVVIAQPLIIIRYGNSQWTSRSFDIWMFKWPHLIWSFENLPSELKQKAAPKEPWRHLTSLVGSRASGVYNVETYRRLISTQSAGRAWQVAAQTIAHVPRPVAAYAVFLYLRMRGTQGVRMFNARQRLRGPRV